MKLFPSPTCSPGTAVVRKDAVLAVLYGRPLINNCTIPEYVLPLFPTHQPVSNAIVSPIIPNSTGAQVLDEMCVPGVHFSIRGFFQLKKNMLTFAFLEYTFRKYF